LALKWWKLDVLKKIRDWAKGYPATEEVINKILLCTKSQGCTAWHMAANHSKLEILQEIWEWAKENLTKEEIKKIVISHRHQWQHRLALVGI